MMLCAGGRIDGCVPGRDPGRPFDGGRLSRCESVASRVRVTPEAAQATWDAETRRADIEDFGLSENLMIAIAILDTGGEFIARDVPFDRVLSDLEAFKDCLALARRTLAT